MSIPTMPLWRPVALASACSLVIASAGFGAIFAWKIGSQHSLPLAVLTVLFAVALEGIKPIAVCGVCSPASLGNFIASLLVASVAIAYSLASELSLVAMSRGDLTASREQVADARRDDQERRTRAKAELTSLLPSRPVAELEALLKASSKERCAIENGTGRWVCPSKAGIQAELGRAKRRQELERILAEPIGENLGTVANADPGALALSTYLAALGITVSVGAVGQWLLLIPVLALELGSALALVLVPRKEVELPKALEMRAEPVLNHAAQATLIPPLHGQILDHLKSHGGSVRTTERGLAARLNSSKPTIHRALQDLAVNGLLILRSSKQGTVLRLAG